MFCGERTNGRYGKLPESWSNRSHRFSSRFGHFDRRGGDSCSSLSQTATESSQQGAGGV